MPAPGTPEMKVRAEVVSFVSNLLVLSYECLSTISAILLGRKQVHQKGWSAIVVTVLETVTERFVQLSPFRTAACHFLSL